MVVTMSMKKKPNQSTTDGGRITEKNSDLTTDDEIMGDELAENTDDDEDHGIELPRLPRVAGSTSGLNAVLQLLWQVNANTNRDMTTESSCSKVLRVMDDPTQRQELRKALSELIGDLPQLHDDAHEILKLLLLQLDTSELGISYIQQQLCSQCRTTKRTELRETVEQIPIKAEESIELAWKKYQQSVETTCYCDTCGEQQPHQKRKSIAPHTAMPNLLLVNFRQFEGGTRRALPLVVGQEPVELIVSEQRYLPWHFVIHDGKSIDDGHYFNMHRDISTFNKFTKIDDDNKPVTQYNSMQQMYEQHPQAVPYIVLYVRYEHFVQQRQWCRTQIYHMEDVQGVLEQEGLDVAAPLPLIVGEDEDVEELNGRRYFTLRFSDSTHRLLRCSRMPEQHNDCDTYVLVDRFHGELTFKCQHPDCRAQLHYQWPKITRSTPLSLEKWTRSLIIAKAPTAKISMSPTVPLAQHIAPLVKKSVAWDVEQDIWRVYEPEKGTWTKASLHTVGLKLRQALIDQLNDANDGWVQSTRSLPVGDLQQIFRQVHEAYNPERCIAKLRQLKEWVALFPSLLAVEEEIWDSYVEGYLPVRNCLLHFQRDGAVVALAYSPEHYVRDERTGGTAVWRGLDYTSAVLEDIMSQWWTKEQRQSWLEAIAYGLSRLSLSEVFFVLNGMPSTAKSTVIKYLRVCFGHANVMITDASLITYGANVKQHHSSSSHNSNEMACFDKAIVVTSEPPTDAYFHQAKIKNMTGDDQSGRAAHQHKVISTPRRFTFIVACNTIPNMEDGADVAMASRMQILRSTNTFIRNEKHQKDLEKMMSREDRKNVKWIHADESKVNELLESTDAASALLAAIAHSWKRYRETKRFTQSPDAKHIADNYFKSQRSTTSDSILPYFQKRLVSDPVNNISKQDLFNDYCTWYDREAEEHGATGPKVFEPHTFHRRISKLAQHWPQYSSTYRPSTQGKKGPYSHRAIRFREKGELQL